MSPKQLDRTPVYQQIADHYAAQIRNGTIAPGDKLPSNVEICRIWHVAGITASSVSATLRDAGLVETGRRGTFARAVTTSSTE